MIDLGFKNIKIYQAPPIPKDSYLIRTEHLIALDNEIQNNLIKDYQKRFQVIDQILGNENLKALLQINKSLMISMTFIKEFKRSYSISGYYHNFANQSEWLNQKLYRKIKQIINNLDEWEYYNLDLDRNVYQNDQFLNWKLPKHLYDYSQKAISTIHQVLIQYCYYFSTFYDNSERIDILIWIETILKKLKLNYPKTVINHKHNSIDFKRVDLDHNGKFSIQGVIDWNKKAYPRIDFNISVSAKTLLRILTKTAYEGPLGNYLINVDWKHLEDFKLTN